MLSIPRKMMKQLTRIYDSPRKILKDCFMTLWILFGFSLDSIWILRYPRFSSGLCNILSASFGILKDAS